MVLLACLTGGGWLVLAKTGTSEAVPATVYTIVRAPGASQDDADLVRRALELSDSGVEEVIGAEVTESVEVRLTRFLSCAGAQTLGSADTDSICLYVGGDSWRYLVDLDPAVAIGAVAHEHLHVLQGQLGCLPDAADREYAWWTEGTATYYSWRELILAGLVTEEQAKDYQEEFADTDERLQPLSAYEESMGGDKAYFFAARAAAELDRRAGGQGFVAFCTQASHGWREAFADVYGIEVDEFYAQFGQG
ncbi:hypothetical protein [Nocardioides okcheonensis]|uniref:hypothetical protein n=1 Tax=Nocardioides okcheonensis TaxID=2894081 RepID=UPI001E3C1BE7|nr:hypothetical protein [Nocardioides okcheonensis]UFN45146.1 hypothetical protein LN652_02710 [Nocardioides okcheonensis]